MYLLITFNSNSVEFGLYKTLKYTNPNLIQP